MNEYQDEPKTAGKHFGMLLLLSLIINASIFIIYAFYSALSSGNEALFAAFVILVFGFFVTIFFSLLWAGVNTGLVYLSLVISKKIKLSVTLATILTLIIGSVIAIYISLPGLSPVDGKENVSAFGESMVMFGLLLVANFIATIIFNLRSYFVSNKQ